VPVRFYHDEHISAHVASGLRRRGIDTITTAEAGLCGASDRAQLEFATKSGKVVETQDDDFLRLHAESVRHSGIAFSRQQSISIGQMFRRPVLLHDLLTQDEMAARVEYL
jgi:predicted nuclease of predicted toxin-antitoxin system